MTKAWFDHKLTGAKQSEDVNYHETENTGHGRFEVRRCSTTPVPEVFHAPKDWKNLSTVIQLQSERRIGENVEVTDRWFISSCKKLPADRALAAIRSHWGIENKLHWTLDMTFDEDHSRLRAENAAENLVVIRHAALNLLRTCTTIPGGVTRRRRKAGWSTKVLRQILTGDGEANT